MINKIRNLIVLNNLDGYIIQKTTNFLLSIQKQVNLKWLQNLQDQRVLFLF